MDLSIVSYCKISNKAVLVNGKEVLQREEGLSLKDYLKVVYQAFSLAYPKFFKMDSLCKLGLLSVELAIRENESFLNHAKENIAIVLSNNASSLDTDRDYKQSIEETFPSPSLFAYTLPNVVNGEIAIKHKITGENIFFVSDEFDLVSTYATILFSTTDTTMVICGWVDVDGNENESFVFCVEKSNFNKEKKAVGLPFNIENINKIV